MLVDFEAGVKGLFGGRSPDELPNQSAMWAAIARADRFYATLPWTEDGRALWDELRNHPSTPYVLTGCPRTKKSRSEKFAWCVRELGGKTNATGAGAGTGNGGGGADLEINHVDMAGARSAHELVFGRRKDKAGVVNIITCWSKNKHRESRRNHVLIDDRLSLREAWEGGGGDIHPSHQYRADARRVTRKGGVGRRRQYSQVRRRIRPSGKLPRLHGIAHWLDPTGLDGTKDCIDPG